MPPATVHRGVMGACAVVALGVAGAVAVAVARTAPPAPIGNEPTGKAIYDARCASCHGASGMGDGPAAALLRDKPRDFTRGLYKFRSTASGSLPTDDDLLRVVDQGLPGTSMIGWKGLLSDADQRAVVAHVKTFSPRFANEPPRPSALAPDRPVTPDRIEAGRRVYASLQCGACHGEDGRAPAAAALQDDWGNLVHAAVLSEPWTFKGGSSAVDIAHRLKSGIDGTPMPALADLASDADIWDLAHFVRSLARKPVWEMTADELTAHYRDRERADAANPVERGRAIAEQCAHCHSPVETDGRIIPGLKFAGGMRMTLSVWGDRVTANLTSDKDTGLGAYTDAEILNAVTRGIKRDGSRMLPFPMGWTAWAHMTDTDQKALVAFLRTIPPVRNRITPPATPGAFTYLLDKFRMLVLGADDPIIVHAGNAGTLSEGQVQQ